MSRIEKGITHYVPCVEIGLHALHQENRDAELQQQQQQQSSSPPAHLPPTTVAPQLIPFAFVNSVAESSPAAEAVKYHFLCMTNSKGLQQNDKVVKFGTCYAHNNAKLAKLAEVVQSSRGREIDVIVLREEVRVGLIDSEDRMGWSRNVGMSSTSYIAFTSASIGMHSFIVIFLLTN